MTDLNEDHEFDEVATGGGGILAIVLLIVAILLLVFLFREELGFGTPHAEIEIPERIEVDEGDAETPPIEALDAQ